MKTFLLILVGAVSLTVVASGQSNPVRRPQSANEASPGTNIADVLVDYGRLTGKKIICDNTVQGSVVFVAPPDENTDRKVELIERTLFLSGFNLVDVGDDVVAVLGLGRPVRTVGLPVYTKPDELPKGQRVFSYVLKLEHRDARELAGILTQYIPPDVATAFTPDRGSNSLIVSGPTNVIRNILKLVPLLDVAADPAEKAAEPGKAK